MTDSLIFRNTINSFVLNIKYAILTIKRVLNVVHFLTLNNSLLLVGFINSKSYKAVRSFYHLDSSFYPVYPWFPGLLTN